MKIFMIMIMDYDDYYNNCVNGFDYFKDFWWVASMLPKRFPLILQEIHVTLISSNVLFHIHTLIFDIKYLQ